MYNHSRSGADERSQRMAARAQRALRERYDAEPAVVSRAPGRLELLGGHTDYNQGFVCAIAIERSAVVAAAPRDGGLVRVWSEAMGEDACFSLADAEDGAVGTWRDYLAGVIWALREWGCPVTGADLIVVSDVPVAGGVSSSAAVEVAYALALTSMAGFTMGMRCGILDQFTAVLAGRGQAMWLDCRSREHRLVPVAGQDLRFVVCDTRKPRELVVSRYNELRAQCEEAARLLGVPALRDLDSATLQAKQRLLTETLTKRVRHVVTENERVQEGLALLEAGDIAGLGDLLSRIHVSLRDDYEVSCPELEAMREAALAAPGCHGARLVGAGFGGCVIAVVDTDAVAQFQAQVAQEYEQAIGMTPVIFATQPGEAAGLLCRTG